MLSRRLPQDWAKWQVEYRKARRPNVFASDLSTASKQRKPEEALDFALHNCDQAAYTFTNNEYVYAIVGFPSFLS